MLSDLLGDPQYLCWTPCKYVLIASEEVDELAFLFGVQAGPNLNGFGKVFGVDLHSLGILEYCESAK
jgi:hypothetical protein